MSSLRRLWRGVARAQSYARTGTTDMMESIFESKWYVQMKHKRNQRAWRATKKGAKHP